MKRALNSLLICAMTLIAMTTTARARPIKVLHVSQWTLNEVQEIVDSVGATSWFDISQVSLASFNNDDIPSNLNEYDVIVFGLNDCYEPDESYCVARTDELESFVQYGGGIAWTHDAIELKCALGSDVEIPAGVEDVGDPEQTLWVWGASVEIIEDHEVLHFPYEIGKVGSTFEVQNTHTVGGIVTTAQKIIDFDQSMEVDNNFYLTANRYGYGRVIVNEIGHGALPCWPADRSPKVQVPLVTESRLFVNCLYWAGMDVRVVTVPGTACFFFAGQDQATLETNYPPDPLGLGDHNNFHNDTALTANSMPPFIEVYGGGRLSISAEGLWGHDPGSTSGPDGYPGAFDSTHDEYEDLGISQVINAELNKLVGVFLTDNPPDPRATPASLTFGIDDMTNPKLQQAFAIGANLADITVPEGATRLFFGLQDGYEWNNNVGSVEVTCEGDVTSRSEVASHPYPADGAMIAGLVLPPKIDPCLMRGFPNIM